ncbi:MAG TPA: metalloregulator ArsR/SmtB family transcription factor [Steroidobacteraceae bacterium]|nr:metalloregulator ArsR/SmtB family transcription factor [Steroidobacteraceae bacterium]
MSFQHFVDSLRATAEASRLRLLAILAKGEFSVTELTQVLRQSQPRVSRHLKLLDEAGLLEKFRERHWIYYRVPADGLGREFVADLLSRVDAADPVLLVDRARVEEVLELRRTVGVASDGAGANSEVATELAPMIAAELGDRGRGALFYFGEAPAVVLGALASRARRVVGMHSSRFEVQRARALLHSRGFSHCLLQQGDLASVPHPTGDFDTVVLDRALASQAGPIEALREAARLINGAGELIVAEDYDALAARTEGANPLTTLKGWLAQAGLVCTRLRPLDLDGRHVVLAVAQAGGAVSAAA